VDQLPDSTSYTLGTRSIILANRAGSQSAVLRAAGGPISDLHGFCGETVFLGDLLNQESNTLLAIPGTRMISVRASSKPGGKLHCTAMGKVLIAFMEPEVRARLLALSGMERMTEHTITDRDVLEEELASVREHGYALNRAEETLGVMGVAAPIWDQRGVVIAGVCVGFPAAYWPGGEIPGLTEEVVRCAAQISANLGHVPNGHR
jgi:DNA-binding IclR family transcriptional regulator